MNKRRTGFTLIEMIIVLALTVIILGIMGSIFTTGNKIFSDSDVKSTLQIGAQTVQEKISNIAMQANEVESADIVNGEVKNLMIKSYVEEDDGSVGERYWTITIKNSSNYKKDGKTLSIIESKDSDGSNIENDQEEIVKNIKSFTINYGGDIIKANSIEFSIVLSKNQGTSTVDYPINFVTEFRNRGLES
jgi:prepilin-type N-terminal cleavage/methylation domain-containing protein